MKKRTIPYLVDKLDKAFSKYIRLRDAMKTTGTGTHLICVTCGRNKDWKYQCDAGHFVGRGAGAVRHDERNVHGQCKQCNMGGNPTAHTDYDEWIIKEYGQDVRDDLIRMGKQAHRYDREWLIEKTKYYRQEFKKLEENL